MYVVGVQCTLYIYNLKNVVKIKINQFLFSYGHVVYFFPQLFYIEEFFIIRKIFSCNIEVYMIPLESRQVFFCKIV